MSFADPLLRGPSRRRSTSVREVYAVRIPEDEKKSVHINFRTPKEDIAYTIKQLAQMLSWPEGWNGQGAIAPSVSSVIKASKWLVQMRTDAIATGKSWGKPHVVPDQDGDIVFEWSNNERTLSVYVSTDAIEYLKVWGADVHSQMQDGYVATREDNKGLWDWLMEEV